MFYVNSVIIPNLIIIWKEKILNQNVMHVVKSILMIQCIKQVKLSTIFYRQVNKKKEEILDKMIKINQEK